MPDGHFMKPFDLTIVEQHIKEVIEKPLNHKKQALKLFDQVISANADTVFKKLLQKATDDDDRDQMAALKLIADRLAPITQFTEQGWYWLWR